MSLWHIAWSYLWNRKLTTCLTVLSVALGVGLIESVLTLREETRKRFEEESQSFDIVIGAKGGSPLQLVLSAVYFMDIPVGTVLFSEYEALKKNPDVAAAFPVCMGDTYRGFRIVGTTRDLFDFAPQDAMTGKVRQRFLLAAGRFFEKPFEAVVGSMVARSEELKLGDTFTGAHGTTAFPEDGGQMPEEMAHSHEAFPYTVVGILAPSGTPNDRAIFCSKESVWAIHTHHKDGEEHEEASDHHEGGEHHDEHKEASDQVSAILLSLDSPASRFTFAREINETPELNVLATIPINQILNLYTNVLGPAKTFLLAVGYLVVTISAISILIGLYLSILQRKRDLAVMRALGAAAFEIVGSVLIEAFLVTVLGIVSGWVLGNLVCGGIGLYLMQTYGLTVGIFGVPTTEELAAFATVGLVGLIAGIVPAWQAYRTDVARDLAEL